MTPVDNAQSCTHRPKHKAKQRVKPKHIPRRLTDCSWIAITQNQHTHKRSREELQQSKTNSDNRARALRDKAPRATHPLLEEALGGLMKRPCLSRVGRCQVGQQNIAGPKQVVPVCDQQSIQIIFPVQMVLIIGGNVGMVCFITCQAKTLAYTCWSRLQGRGHRCVRLCKKFCTLDPRGRTAKHHHDKVCACYAWQH